ncbi:hypothetical protein PRtIB026_A41370 [Pseudomonas sp. RtIB026]|nr:hypothetical protein PRtIB026_A41370 [Pseudomonas sp. RtIB026]
MVVFGLGQRWMLLGRQAVELQALLVEVVTVLDLEMQAHLAVFQAIVGQGEGLVDRQEVRLYRKGVGLEGAGEQECQEEQENTHVDALAEL